MTAVHKGRSVVMPALVESHSASGDRVAGRSRETPIRSRLRCYYGEPRMIARLPVTAIVSASKRRNAGGASWSLLKAR